MSAALDRSRYHLSRMDCASCAAKVGTAVRLFPGLEDVSVSVSTETMTVTHVSSPDAGALERQVRNLGYGIAPAAVGPGSATASHVGRDHRGHNEWASAHGHLHSHAENGGGAAWWKTRKARLTAACGAALVAAYVFGHAVPGMERDAFLLALAIRLVPVARRAITEARYGTPFSIEMLMTVAAVGAVIILANLRAALARVCCHVGR